MAETIVPPASSRGRRRRFEVTQDRIDRGEPGRRGFCPVALTISETLGKPVECYDHDAARIHLGRRGPRLVDFIVVRFSRAVAARIRGLDRKPHRMEPFAFYLCLPETL